MNARKYRWSRVYESAEEELMDYLADKHVTATRYELEDYSTQELAVPQDLHVWGVEGTAVFTVDGKDFSLQAGDAFAIPANSTCTITTSISNFAWYQSSDAN